MNNYLKTMKIDKSQMNNYYLFYYSIKSEQQKFIEKNITLNNVNLKSVIDVCCGGGSTIYHLSKLLDCDCSYTLIDINEEAINIAKEKININNSVFKVGDFCKLPSIPNYNLVLCLQSVMMMEKPFDAIQKLVDLCLPNGKIIISSLFNEFHDVDIYSKIIDYTRPSSSIDLYYQYVTLSLNNLKRKLSYDKRISSIDYFPFELPFEIDKNGYGIGTYTRKLFDNSNIQISGGHLMNWGFLVINM